VRAHGVVGQFRVIAPAHQELPGAVALTIVLERRKALCEQAASGSELVLANNTTEIRLLDRTFADPDRPLIATRWVVQTIVDRDIASSIPQGAMAHLVVNADGTFTGNTGCNNMGGTAAITNVALRFSGVFTTKMACEPDRMRLEQAVLGVLDGDVNYEIEADLLRLRHSSGKGIDLRAER